MFCLLVVPKEILYVSHLRTEGQLGIFVHASTNLHMYSKHNVDIVIDLGISVDKNQPINWS
jgi:hypothetical protein